MKKILLISFLLIGVSNILLLGQDKKMELCTSTNLKSGGPVFIENRGQLRGTDYLPHNEILYYFDSGEFTAYFSKTAIYYVYQRTELPSLIASTDNPSLLEMKKFPKDVNITTYRLDIYPENINQNTEINGENIQPTYLNFYYSHCPQGITSVKTFKKLIYRNIYPNIDLVFYFKDESSQLKYDFIVHPGGNPDNISLNYSEKPILDATGKLTLSCPLGTFIENKPFVYQGNDKNSEIPSSYYLDNKSLKFKIDNYDKKTDLIIDPVINWSTYYGGENGDHSSGLAIDSKANPIMTGNTLSKFFPVTTAHTFKGGYDIFLVKFDYQGNRKWATYFGGNQSDYVGGLDVDIADRIYIAGWTWDRAFPVTSGAFQSSFLGGDNDGIIAKFTRDGTLEWSTYAGGDRTEHFYGIAVDKNYNLAIVGWSQSLNFPNNLQPISPRVFMDDVVLMSMDENGQYRWATYLGGDSIDAGQAVVYNEKDEILISGYTKSNFFAVTADAYQKNSGGSYDAFFAKFDNSGNKIYCSYLGGFDNDYGTGISVDSLKNFVVTGYTSSKDFPVTADAYQSTNKGNIDVFVSKFSDDGRIKYSTLFGGSNDDMGNAVYQDRVGNVIVCGQTYSSNFPVTQNAIQKKLSGSCDAFAFKFSPDFKIQYWSTFYGGNDEDAAYGITTDFYQSIYLTGDTKSTDFPITAGAYQNKYAGSIDCFLLKHCATSPNPIIKINSPTVICEDDSVELDGGDGYFLYEWSNGMTSRIIKATVSGSYTVKVTDSMYCDAISPPVLVTVLPKPRPTIQGNKIICKGDSLILTTQAGFVKYLWSNGDTTRTAICKKGGIIKVTVTDAKGCKGSDSIYVTQFPKPSPKIHGPDIVCAFSKNVIYDVYGVAGHVYKWEIDGGTIDYGSDYFTIQVNWTKTGKAKIKIYQTDNTTGCTGVDSIMVTVTDKLEPKVTSNTGKFYFCDGDSIELQAGLSYIDYKWSTGETTNTIIVKNSGKITVKVMGNGGCVGYDTVNVLKYPVPDPTITGDTVFCFSDDIATYSAQKFANHKYTWNINGATVISGIGTPEVKLKWTSPGTAEIELTETDELSGCQTTSKMLKVRIIDLPKPKITNVGKLVFCDGDSVLLDAGAGFKSYLWSNSETTQTIIARTSGLYKVTVTNDDGCINADSVSVNVLPVPLKPLVANVNDTLRTITANSYQWYYNSVPIPGATDSYYFPRESGMYSVKVTNASGCDNKSSEYNVNILPIVAECDIAIPDTVFGKTGDFFELPISIAKSIYLNKVKAYNYKLYLTVNKHILLPDKKYTILNENAEFLSFMLDGTRTDTVGLLNKLGFFIALGDSICSTIVLDSLVWPNSNVNVKLKNTVVCITNICRAGGARLYLDNGNLQLNQNYPNPFNSKTTIEFQTIEDGPTSLYLIDVYGRKSKVIAENLVKAGSYTADIYIDNLSDGIYFYVLETPTAKLMKKLQIIK